MIFYHKKVLMRIISIAILLCFVSFSWSQHTSPDDLCPVDEIRYHSTFVSNEKLSTSPDTLAVRLFVFYSKDDYAFYGIDSSEYIRAITHMVRSQGNKISHISGLVDTTQVAAFEIVAFKALDEEDFGGITYGCSIISHLFNDADGVMDQELIDYECSNAQTALLITPNNVNSPNGCSSGNGIQIRAFWIWAYYTQGLIPWESAETAQDSATALFALDNRANTLFHELGHNMGGKHFAGEGSDETQGVFFGRSQYGSLPSIMYGAYGSSAFHFSNIHGPEPLTDGIVDHVSYMIKSRMNKHETKPILKIQIEATLDTLRLGTQDITQIDLSSNYQEWEDMNELIYKIIRPDGSMAQGNNFVIEASWSGLTIGPNIFILEVKRDCEYGPVATDSMTIWLNDESTSTIEVNEFIPSIYPNPCQDFISVSAPEAILYTIFNSSGIRVQEGRLSEAWINQKINIKQLTDGIYFIDIRTGKNGKFHIEKFIKCRS